MGSKEMSLIQDLPRNEYLTGKEIMVSIFTKKRRRSGHVIVVGSHLPTLEQWRYSLSSSVGAKTALASVPDTKNTIALTRAVRELTPNLLNDTCVLFLHGTQDVITLDFARKLSAAMRAGLLYLPKSDASTLSQQCQELRNNLPDPTIPVFGLRVPTNLERDIDPKLKAEFRDNLAVSQCAREITIAYQVMQCRKAMLHRPPDESRDVIVYVVGYTPTLVHATLRSGGRPIFYDHFFPKLGSLICPDLSHLLVSAVSRKKKDAGWIRTNPQRKIAVTAYLGLSLAPQILYIGSYPGTNMLDLNLIGHKIIFVDPLIDDHYVVKMSVVCPESTFKREIYHFTYENFTELIARKFDMSKKVVILNDAWIEGPEYETFQRKAFNHFADLCNRYDNITVISKFHMRYEYNIRRVIALLPQPYGGSTNEMRILFRSDGRDYTFLPSRVEQYMKDFHSLDVDAQLWCVNFYYHFLVRQTDVLKTEPKYNTVYSGLFSLSNDMNRKKHVIKWLTQANQNRNIVSFTTPNKERTQILLQSGYDPKTSITIKGDVFIFNSPVRGKPWRDMCYSPIEMSACNMECITLEALSGIMGSQYRGVGCYTQSAAFDTYDIYISKDVVRSSTVVQHVGTSPLGFVKAFTHQFLKDGGMRRQSYYTNRALLLRRYLDRIGVSRDSYKVIGTEVCTIETLTKIIVSTKYGMVRMFPGAKVNLSGHLLSMFVAAHFVSVSFEMWVRQLIHMAVDVPAAELLNQVDTPLELFDNLSRNGMFNHWHTLNELLLTAEIVPDYVSSVMMNKHSPALIDTHLNHLRDILSPLSDS